MSHRVEESKKLVELLRDTADRLEREDRGNLTGVAIVIEATPGTFKKPGPMSGAWVSMKGGGELYRGLLGVAMDIATLRRAKQEKVH